MKISLNWLKRYVDIPVSVETLCDKMVMAGFEVESVENLAETMVNVVVGKIVDLQPHENSDHLQICQIDIGAAEPVQIVTGAQNVFVGAYVPAALDHSHLPNGMDIKKGKLRGVESNGMLCSGEELGLTEHDYKGASVNGIMIMDDAYPVGTDLREIFGLNDIVIDFKITANRPDCNCVLGVAREVGVVLGQPFRMPEPTYATAGGDVKDYISVTVKDYDLCPRYCGTVVTDVVIKDSPAWIKAAVKSAGMRPINNIVDITNFVMLETGQPMHAFDYRDIAGKQIIVRRAAPGEQMTTLDDKVRTLTEEMLVIADAENPSCLAGIMGGLNSEIKDDTTTLFFETAKFRRDNIRRTARTLGMRSESSSRFERGVDIIGTEYAMHRALQLIAETGSGKIVSGMIDQNNGLPQPRTLIAAVDSVNALLGLQIPAEKMVEILNSLCIETELQGQNLVCKIPSYRDDIEGRADLAEEVMRIYGYEHIVGTAMRGDVVRGKKLPERIKADCIKSALVSQGLYEISTYSFIGSKAIDALRLPVEDSRRRAIRLLNPLGDEYSTMRTQLVTSMLTVLATNLNRKNPNVRLFEISKHFVSKEIPAVKQPQEVPAMVIGAYGEKEDFFSLKGMVETVLRIFGIEQNCIRAEEPYYHPGRCAEYVVDGHRVAVLGEVHPEVAADFELGSRAYVAEIALDELYKIEKEKTVYQPLPKFPAVGRDFALLCDVQLPVGDMENAIAKAAGKLLENIHLFDVYTGSQIPEGKKSVAFNVTLRSKEATLSQEEIDRITQKIIKNLEQIGAALRS
ncbi:MAG: phenylalanine--tRNA ligase subunit beta [Clostridia bacterium]|nr:phenylalanine--tRNA ligase subunit beta [Clostridia bacterium]